MSEESPKYGVEDDEKRTCFAVALCRVQAQLEHAKRTTNNEYFASKYAELSEVWDVLKKPLTDNGFAVVQLPRVDYFALIDRTNYKKDGSVHQLKVPRVTVESSVMHANGHVLVSEISASPIEDTPQAIGSAITYLRRYSLMSIFGVCPADDDGAQASGKAPEQKPINNKPPASTPPPAVTLPPKKTPPAKAPMPTKKGAITVDGVVRYDGEMLNEDYQKEHLLITTPQLVELRNMIKTKLGGAWPKFQKWLKEWHKVEWYDISRSDIESIYMMLQKHPDRVVKGEGYPTAGDK